ncbi:MAG: hypothetical protein R3C68_13135 [Myxococcota bacterium]
MNISVEAPKESPGTDTVGTMNLAPNPTSQQTGVSKKSKSGAFMNSTPAAVEIGKADRLLPTRPFTDTQPDSATLLNNEKGSVAPRLLKATAAAVAIPAAFFVPAYLGSIVAGPALGLFFGVGALVILAAASADLSG